MLFNEFGDHKVWPCGEFKNLQGPVEQKAQLWQRDRTMRLSVEILQLQNILFEN